jgi:hypothetical protein
MAMTAHLIVPSLARPGDVLPIEATLRRGQDVGPDRAITGFVCRYNAKVIFRADWQVPSTKDPVLLFHAQADSSGTLEFIWIDRGGTEYRAVTMLAVS